MFRNRLMSLTEGKTVSSNDTVPSSQTDGFQMSSDGPGHRRQSVASTGHSHNLHAGVGRFGGAMKNVNLGGGSVSSPNLISPQPRPSISNTKGPSLVGLLASKRLAKQLSTRFLRRRYGSLCDSSKASLPPKKEPTYRMEPYRKFNSCKVRCSVDLLFVVGKWSL